MDGEDAAIAVVRSRQSAVGGEKESPIVPTRNRKRLIAIIIGINARAPRIFASWDHMTASTKSTSEMKPIP